MSEQEIKIYLAIDHRAEMVTISTTITAEDVCIVLCKRLGVGTVARHLFGLRIHGKPIFLKTGAKFDQKYRDFDFRVRYKPTDISKLYKLDAKAYDYLFHQTRLDVLDNKIPELLQEKYRKELVGLGITDMYRAMLEKNIPLEVIETDYKKYMPKEVLKRHMFFVKRPIHDTLVGMRRGNYDVRFVKSEYLKQVNKLAPEYLVEEYKTVLEDNGTESLVIVKLSQFAPEPGINYLYQDKKDKWHNVCSLEDLAFITIRDDLRVEISRKNGVPCYLRFGNQPEMMSFVSFVDGYYRLAVKWTFNVCKDVITPSLQKLSIMRCHGPVGGEFSYAKLEEVRGNKAGCFIVRESETQYNIYYIDVCTKNSSTPKTFKLELLSNNEFIFDNDLTKYKTIGQLIQAYGNEDNDVYLKELLPPSEYDKSPLLMCHKPTAGHALADMSDMVATMPVCIINHKDLQVYKGKNCLKWSKKGPKVKVDDAIIPKRKFERHLFPDETISDSKNFCRNPDGDPNGAWCFVETSQKKIIEKQYCDVPSCDDETCMVFTKDHQQYTHYTRFPDTLTNFTFGVKLWDPDSYLNASVRIVLSLYSIPLSGGQLDDLGIGVELFISNRKSGLTAGKADKVEYEDTRGILKSHKFVYFQVTWWHNVLTLFLEGRKQPIFIANMKSKGTLIERKLNQFNFYAAQGTNAMWNFPFCDDDEQCNVHTTTQGNFQHFFPLRETADGQDLSFNLRAVSSANILLVSSPSSQYPYFKIVLQRVDNVTVVIYKEHSKKPEAVLKEVFADNILKYWTWQEFLLSIFLDELQLLAVKSGTAHPVLNFQHGALKGMRWFSPSSEDSLAHWTFFCLPPVEVYPPTPYLPECVLNRHEPFYNGTQSETSRGAPCLPWAGQNLIPAEVNGLFLDAESKFSANNFCRDPKNQQNGTFCYTFQKDGDQAVVKRELCNIRKCRSAECKMAGTANDYIGKMSTTRSNRTCQHWLSQEQLNKLNAPSNLLDEGISTPEVLDRIDSTGYLRKELRSIDEVLDISTCRDEWRKCQRSLHPIPFVSREKPKEDGDVSATTTRKEFSDSDVYVDGISDSPPHGSEVGRLEKIGENRLINKMIEEETENSNSGFTYPYVHDVNLALLNETLFADMNLLKIENYCRNPSRDIGAQKKVGSDGMTFVYRSMWKFAKTKKTEVAMKVLRPEFKDKHLKEFLESAAEWACLESRYFVKLVGVTLTSQISMVMEYFKLGPLDQYLRENAKKTTPADLMETATSLSFALWYLEEHGIVHGKIRCRKLLVCHHSDRELKVKLSDPGIRNDYDKSEIHWIPVEYYGKLEHARHSSAADVWAYGTTLWEIFSYGQKIRDMDHFEARKIYVGGKRLPKPPRCPDSIYDLMLECWHKDQHNRKKPQAIVRDISQLMYQVYHSRREHLYAKVFSSRSKRFARTDSCESLLSNITASTAPIHEISGEVRSIDEECELVLPTADGEGHEMIGGDGFDSTSDDFSMEFRNLNLSTEFSGIDSSFSSMQSIFELDDYNVILQGRIGEGYYGEVYRGTLEQLGNENELKEVAVKKLKKSAVSSTRQDFEREIEIMKALKHRNIVEIMGVQHEPEVLLVMEYIYHGSLQCYVKIHKDHLTIKQLMKYSLDIACGMQYLVRKNIVHRDLAARNILVVDEGHVKISDFGLARFMESDSDYYVLQTNRELPVKWYAPESIEEGKFSPRSDVWSYGVTLWEMFTYGEEPKFGVENKTKEPEQQHMLKLLQQGVRYPCLPQIPNAIFVRIIYPCWEFNQHNRPTFSTLCDVLENDLRNDIV